MRVIIGHDSREPMASKVALRSLYAVTHGEIRGELLDVRKLRAQGLYTRPEEYRDGQRFDLLSQAPCSTEFSITRFLTPLLVQSGMALFVDGDVVFREDPRAMAFKLDSPLAVVKHNYTPRAGAKMDGQTQTVYPRKNWSSVMLFDCDHLANRRLTLKMVNTLPGRDLHRFCWLLDDEIAALDVRWNWLVGEQLEPAPGGVAHFTLGGPFTPGWQGAPHDDIWLEALDA